MLDLRYVCKNDCPGSVKHQGEDTGRGLRSELQCTSVFSRAASCHPCGKDTKGSASAGGKVSLGGLPAPPARSEAIRSRRQPPLRPGSLHNVPFLLEASPGERGPFPANHNHDGGKHEKHWAARSAGLTAPSKVICTSETSLQPGIFTAFQRFTVVSDKRTQGALIYRWLFCSHVLTFSRFLSIHWILSSMFSTACWTQRSWALFSSREPKNPFTCWHKCERAVEEAGMSLSSTGGPARHPWPSNAAPSTPFPNSLHPKNSLFKRTVS